jgi:hypothetical protein
MKKLISIIFTLLSLNLFANSLPTFFVKHYKLISKTKSYKLFEENRHKVLKIEILNTNINYKTKEVEVSIEFWNNITLEEKYLLISALIIELQNTTKSIDICVSVGNMVVYLVTNGKVIVEKIN